MADPRYASSKLLTHHLDRRVTLATDRWSGRTVVLKTARFPSMRREARALLSIPAGVGPALRDLVWKGSRRMALVLERLDGTPLAEAAPRIGPDRVPEMALAICRGLSRIHRAGWIHSDLTPGNILVRDDGRLSVRLIDFGYAIDRYGGPDEEDRGGTPPYIAPEIARGWMVDGRADLYSLGQLLDRLFPAIRDDARWIPILGRLREERPAARPAHANEVRDEIARVFATGSGAPDFPSFGAGAMRGRDTQMRQVVERLMAQPGARILVQADPHAGLSRFLMEAALATAERNGPPVRILDLAADDVPAGCPAAREMLMMQEGHALLCGIADPSPGLRRTDGAWREIILTGGWEPVVLPRMDAESIREILAATTGTADAGTAGLAVALHDGADGDLGLCAEGFAAGIARCGFEQGPSIRIAPDRIGLALGSWSPCPPGPAPTDLPEPILAASALCARLGPSFPSVVCEGLLAAFPTGARIEELREWGILSDAPGGRLRFIYRKTRIESAKHPVPADHEVARWIHEHDLHDPEIADDVIGAASIAGRVGDGHREQEILAEGILRARAGRRWKDVLRLLAYPGEPPEAYTEESALRLVESAGMRLGSRWTRKYILAMAAASIKTLDTPLGIRLLESAVSQDDPRASYEALAILTDFLADRPAEAGYPRRIEELRALENVEGGTPAGLVDFLEARRGIRDGRLAESREHAVRAAEALAGSGSLIETLNLQLLAVLDHLRGETESARRTLQSAISSSGDPTLRAQMRYNLSNMSDPLCMAEHEAGCADEGIHDAERHGVTAATIHGLRIRRAWAWAHLDRIDSALEEGRALLQRPAVRLAPHRLCDVQGLIAFCHRHRGAAVEATRMAIATWTEARESGAPVGLQANSLLRLIDTLEDLDRRDIAAEMIGTMVAWSGGQDDTSRIAILRAKALAARLNTASAEAASILEEGIEAVRKLEDKPDVGRYLHQLGSVLLEIGSAESTRRAAEIFREEYEIFRPPHDPDRPGYGYESARAILGLSRALLASNRKREAVLLLSDGIALTRRIRALGLLARLLDTRAAARLAS